MGTSTSKHSPEVGIAMEALGEATVKSIQTALNVDEDKNYHVELKDLKNLYPQWSDDMLETVRNGVRAIPETQDTIPMHCWIVTLRKLASGSASDRQSVYYRLACGDENKLSDEKLMCFLTNVCKSAFAVDEELDGKLDSEKEVAKNFINSLTSGLILPTDVDGFTTWMRRDPVVSNILEFGVRYYILQRTCGAYFEKNVFNARVLRPTPLQLKGFGQSRSKLMTREGVWYINAHLPKDMAQEWELLYDSETMGKAFAQFMAHSFDVSPIVFIIKDKDGYVFGGFVSEPLKLNASWYGDSDCFLFTLAPTMAVHHTTSYNKNYVYLNKAQKTLPNGFGMGGQIEAYFGMWINPDLESGHSKAHPTCSTYGSPRLSKMEDFKIDYCEVWRVGPLPEREEVRKGPGALADSEAMAFMEMAGRTFVTKEMGIDDNKKPPEDNE